MLPVIAEHLPLSQFSNLEIALRDYCGNLMKEANLTSCDLQNADPELPTASEVFLMDEVECLSETLNTTFVTIQNDLNGQQVEIQNLSTEYDEQQSEIVL